MSGEARLVRSIVERALAPDEWERQYPDAPLLTSSDAAHEASHALARWEERLAIGADADLFARRLRSLGLDRDGARRRLTARRLPDDGGLPRWAHVLDEVLKPEAATRRADAPSIGTPTAEERVFWGLDVADVPLLPALAAPFIDVARQRVGRAPRDAEVDLSALAPVWRYLLVRLSRVAARTVAYEVKRAAAEWRLEGETPESRYECFARTVLASVDGRQELFTRYPVLGRLMAQSTDDLAAAMREVLRALLADRRALARHFHPGRLASLTPGLSDPHRHGRTVCRLRFANGVTLAYKPRSVQSDLVFAEVIDRFNREAGRFALRSARALDRGTHGWCEWIDEQPCRSRAAVGRWYARQGALLALLHGLCATDIHRENLIAHGEWPVVVDLEGLAAQGAYLDERTAADTPPEFRPLATTVLATGMLPQWMAGDPDRMLEVSSAIGGNAGRPYAVRWPTWQRTGTDEVHLAFAYPPRPESHNLPRLGGRRIGPGPFVDDLDRGFAAGYRWLARHGLGLLARRGRQPLGTCTARVLLRPTREYYDLLQWSSAPDQLVSGAAYDVALEMMCRGRQVDVAAGAPIIALEKRALWRGDIPIFTALASGRTLRGEGERLGRAFPQSALTRIRSRLASASDEDLRHQSALLRTSLRVSLEPAPLRRVRSARGPSDLTGAAIAIADTFDRLALRGPRGAQWLTLSRWPAPSRLVETRLSDPWLHSGTAGTAIFLAHVACLTGQRRHAELAADALEHAWQAWQWLSERGVRRADSAFTGPVSLVYAFAECGVLLDDARWIDRALAIAAHPSLARGPQPPERAGDPQLNPDLMGGLSGVLLARLRLEALRPDAVRLAQLRDLGDAIIGLQVGAGDARGWRTPLADRPLAGMAHGAAGIAHALLRLFERTRDERFREAALAGFAYEHQVFSADHQDWPNLQARGTTPAFMKGWCAGAAGIGLSRIASARIIGRSEAGEREIDRAIAATRRHLGSGLDHLCCGEAGRIVFLAEAGREDRPHAGEAARDAASALLDAYRRSGAWNLHDFRERATQSSLMSGAAGIGLALLAADGASAAGRVLWLS